MLKRIVLAVLLIGLVGLLAFGAVSRTLAKTSSDEGYGGGRGNGSGGGRGNSSGGAYTGDGTGAGQAQVDEWLALSGAVTAADAGLLAVKTGSGEVAVENRGWWYAQEQGFAAQAGDRVTLTGFYENGVFQVGRIDNLTTGQAVTLRDETGRPLWAGRGRRGG